MSEHNTKRYKSLLMITYVYPPLAYGGTYRSIRLSKYLSKIGYQISVLTIKKQRDLDNDDELLNEVPASVAIERTGTFDPWRSYQKIKNRLQSSLPGKVVAKFLSAILFITNQPDHMVFWIPFAVWRGRKLIREKNIEVVYTSTPPHSSQVIGYLLKKMTGVKWIADFRDPIVGNLGGRDWGAYERKVNTWLERLVCRHADHVVANTDYVRKQLASRYPECRVSAVRNSFDSDDFSDVSSNQSKKFTIAHIGSLYIFRKIDSIIKAVEHVVYQLKLKPEDICLRLVGLRDPSITVQIEQSKIQQYVIFEDMVPHSDAVKIMTETTVLLLIKGFGVDSGAQIPGKLYEYLGSGNKILYLGPADAEAADIIRESDAGYVVENDVDELIDILIKEYNIWKDRDKTQTPTINRKVQQYTGLVMAQKMDRILESL